MSFNLLPIRRIRIEDRPELMTVERPVELADPWQDIYELDAAQYHELDSEALESIETNYSAMRNPYRDNFEEGVVAPCR